MSILAHLGVDIVKLWNTYASVYLTGMWKTVSLAVICTLVGCLIGFLCGVLQTIPVAKKDNALKKGLLGVLRGIIRRNRRGLPATLAICLRGDDRLIGTIGFQWINIESRSCEIGYSIARRLWNRGLATDALKAILPFAFDTLGLNRVEARHDVRNPASGRVMERAGFKLEGISRECLMLKGRLADMANYALIKEEYMKVSER